MERSTLRRWVESLSWVRFSGKANRRRLRRALNLDALEGRAVPAGLPELLSNVNVATASAFPEEFTEVGRTIFFRARNDDGVELWKTDGTAAGTALVKDIDPGDPGSYPEYLTNFRGTLFFVAGDNDHGNELWKSDGTPEGTVLVKDINPGSAGANPFNLTVIGRTLYFTANDGVNGAELWKTDGTEAGTVLVKDIRPGGAGSNPRYHTVLKGKLFFTANDGTTGRELWKSDGTAAGTVLVKDINPGSASSNPDNLTVVGDRLFFAANDGTNGDELWRSNGNAAGTVLVEDIRPGAAGSNPNELTAVGDRLFFTANDGVTGIELWRSNGNAANTRLVEDIDPSSSSGFPNGSNPDQLTAVSGVLFFSADDGVTGTELWKSDGTAAGTVLVKDIRPGTGNYGYILSSRPDQLTEFRGRLYFSAADDEHGRELWASNGTTAGTVLVKDINPGEAGSRPVYLADVGGTLFFGADDGLLGQELWKSNGTTAGTVLVADVNQSGIGSFPSQFAGSNGTTFFRADDGVHGGELWKTDGTQGGTVLVKDINPGSSYGSPFDSNLNFLVMVGDTLFFSANDGVNGTELWKSDGTEAGTVQVKDINPGSSYGYAYSSNPFRLTAVGGTLFFRARDGEHGDELWKSDGTPEGTVLVKDINPGGSTIDNLTNVGGTLYFTADDGINGTELWKSDGTEAGTVLVKDINPGSSPYGVPNSSSPNELTAVGGTVYFSAFDETAGRELWKSDGTAAGTVLVKDINPGSFYPGFPNGSFPNTFANVGGTLFFAAFEAEHGRELWKSDGTEAGTVLVKDINPGSYSGFPSDSSPSALTAVGGTLYFSANDGVHGRELWKSDGTEAGTVMVRDINPGSYSGYPAGSFPSNLTAVGGTLYFTADDGEHGTELWTTDGTEAGTVMVMDINPGSDGSAPNYLAFVNGALFFAADDGQSGLEPWILRWDP